MRAGKWPFCRENGTPCHGKNKTIEIGNGFTISAIQSLGLIMHLDNASKIGLGNWKRPSGA